MTQRYLILLWVFIASTLTVIGQSRSSLENAKQAYEHDDYDSAIQFFELTVGGGIYNGDIFYNLGNTYYQKGDIAHALLNYRRALQSLPRDLDLNIQLARTRSLRTVPQSDTTHPLILIEQITETILTINELSIVTLVMWTIFWLLLGIYQLRQQWRSTLKPIISIVFVLLIFASGLFGTRLYIHNNMPPAIVTSGTATIYSGPSVSYFHQYDLFAASEIYVVEEHDEWRRFVTSGNRQGWVQAEFISIVPLK